MVCMSSVASLVRRSPIFKTGYNIVKNFAPCLNENESGRNRGRQLCSSFLKKHAQMREKESCLPIILHIIHRAERSSTQGSFSGTVIRTWCGLNDVQFVVLPNPCFCTRNGTPIKTIQIVALTDYHRFQNQDQHEDVSLVKNRSCLLPTLNLSCQMLLFYVPVSEERVHL